MRQAELPQIGTILAYVEEAHIGDELALAQVQIAYEDAPFADGLHTLIVDTGAVAEIDELKVDVVVETSRRELWRWRRRDDKQRQIETTSHVHIL